MPEVPPLTVTIAATDADAAEEGLDPGEFTITLSDAAPTGGIEISYSVGGSALPTLDYNALPETVTIAEGETSVTIPVTPVDDADEEAGDAETVVVTLIASDAYDLGATDDATVTIADNDAPAQIIQLSTPDAELGVGEEFVVTVSYDVTDADNTLTGIGVRVHYDSTELAFDTSSVLVGSLFAPVTSGLEDIDDGDADTDSQITFAYTDFGGNFPNVVLPADLLTLSFTTLEGFDGSNLNVTFSALASGYIGEAAPLALELEPVVENTAPVITSAAEFTVAENTTTVGTIAATDAEGDALTYSISGDDVALFAIDDAGALSFIAAPDFEVPADAGADNIYNVQVQVSDGIETVTQDLTVTVADVPENTAPVITSTAFTVNENTTTVGTIVATDAEGDALTYSISGDDAALFTIDPATGELSFVAAPDFEVPGDASLDNIYNVQVQVSDGIETVTQDLTVTVADVPEVPPLTVTIAATDNAASEQGDNPGEFTVTLSDAPTADLELTYTVAGTATAGDDYTALTGTVTVLAGETTATIAVIPVEDAITDEGNESVIVTLTDGAAYDLGATVEAEVTIADSVITDIDGNTTINGADIALLNQFLLLPNSDALQATFDQFPSLTEGASNLTGDALNAAIQEQLSLFDIDGNGRTTGGDIFLINTYNLGASDPNIEAILEATAANLLSELTGPNTTGAGLNTTLSALFG